METKTIIVLANSTKNRGHCIAGIEYTDGNWIRPVSNYGNGELYPQQIAFSDGTQPSLLDVVEIPVVANAKSPLQPENWTIQEGIVWKKNLEGKCSKEMLLSMVAEPNDIWLQPNYESNRNSHDYLHNHPPYSSLVLVKISAAKLWKDRSFNGKEIVRSLFSYHGVTYTLNVTDPNVHNILNGADTLNIKEAIICVSLCPSFYNNFASEYQHFKVVASIILL